MRLSALLLLGSALVLSCGAARSGAHEGTFAFSAESRANARSHMRGVGTSILLDVLEGYFSVKDGLAADDAAKAGVAIPIFSQTIGRLDTFIGCGDIWPERDSLLNAVAAMRVLAGTTDLAVVRSHFSQASSALYSTLQLAGFRGITVYRFYDPAAFNDSGAYWLSYSPKIRNPYFGRKMPEWGELVDTLR